MGRRPINKTWTSEDIVRLIELAESGATVLRALPPLGALQQLFKTRPANWGSR
jgi:hypothetical protein